jgi:hypothetical protein
MREPYLAPSLVVPRLTFAVILSLVALVAVAGAQDSPTTTLQHDESRDGTPREVRSGHYGGDPAGTTDPIAERPSNSYETFPVDVPEGSRHSRLDASIGWKDERIDFDLSIYRTDAAGNAVAPALARSASKSSDTERAVYVPSGGAVEPGRYLVVVDNVCSRDADGAPGCGIGENIPDEDDFSGTVTLGNQPPTVTLTGPASVRAKETVTFRAEASDPDGTISTFLFDLDGDGTYELDSDGIPEVTTAFATRGRRTIGVQVLDDSGAAAFATREVRVTRALDTRPPIQTFRLSRTSFGGAAKRSLTVTYRLREKARVEVKLRRGAGAGKLVRLIERGVRTRNRYHRIRLRPDHLRRGRYVVRIFVHPASGKRQVAQLAARRR